MKEYFVFQPNYSHYTLNYHKHNKNVQQEAEGNRQLASSSRRENNIKLEVAMVKKEKI
jgi:hypothetical protein